MRNYLAIFRCFSTSAIVFTWDNVLCYIICARAVSVKPCSEETNESIRLFVQSREQSVIRWKFCYACLETYYCLPLLFPLCSILLYKPGALKNVCNEGKLRSKCNRFLKARIPFGQTTIHRIKAKEYAKWITILLNKYKLYRRSLSCIPFLHEIDDFPIKM